MTTPNHAPAHELQIDQANVLALDNVEILRQAQLIEINRVEMARFSDSDVPAANLDALTSAFVESQLGLASDDPQRLEVEAIFRAHSIDRISTDHWVAGPYVHTPGATLDDEGIVTLEEEPSGRERFAQAAAEYTATQATPTPAPPTPGNHELTGDALTAAYDQLETLRGDLASLTARKSGKAINFSNTKYNQALAAYNTQLIAVGRMREAQLETENPGRTDDERNIETIGYLLDEQRGLREATIAEFQSSKTNKAIEWFNRGGKVTRIAKGILVGAPAAVLAAFAAPAGAAAAVVGGGVIASRFTRSYARHDKQRGTNISPDGVDEAGLQNAFQTGDADDRVQNAVSHLVERFDGDKKNEQSNRRKSLYWGLGGIAVGVTGGWIIGASSNLREHTKTALTHGKENAKHAFGGTPNYGPHPIATPSASPSPSPSPSAMPSAEASPTPQTTASSSPAPTEMASPAPSEAPSKSPATAPAEPAKDAIPQQRRNSWMRTYPRPDTDHNWSSDALTIERGEGFFQTFEDMDIPQKEWKELLQDIGPKLEEQNLAYKMPNGEWGISRPGQMPESVLQLIQDSRR